jgi:GT2 family glycosyltransferase
MNESIAVVIPSLNSPIIDQVIAAVWQQQCSHCIEEIVVVGRDERGLLPVDSRLRFIDTNEPVWASQARNLGIAVTKARLLIFLDSDCLPLPGWLAGHIAAQSAGHPVVSGSVIPEGNSYWHLTYNLTLFHEWFSTASAGARGFLATLNLSVARSVIIQVGMLDENIDRVEDVDWTIRMRRSGIQPYFAPAAAVRHCHNRTTMRQVWRDCARSGYHMRRLRLHHADLLEAPTLLHTPRLLWWLAPGIAAWATGRLVSKRPATFLRYWYALPGVFLTKIAWCWGASQKQEPQ